MARFNSELAAARRAAWEGDYGFAAGHGLLGVAQSANVLMGAAVQLPLTLLNVVTAVDQELATPALRRIGFSELDVEGTRLFLAQANPIEMEAAVGGLASKVTTNAPRLWSAASEKLGFSAKPLDLSVLFDTGPVAGETSSTTIGKEVHRAQAEARRASGMFDVVNAPILDKQGNPILVPKYFDLVTGEPIPGSPMQTAEPDAASFARKLIVDDKPEGRPLAKDRQELIRFVKAYERREGELPERVAIQRYDPVTKEPIRTDLHKPEEILPSRSSDSRGGDVVIREAESDSDD
jgi:hypothetical protein